MYKYPCISIQMVIIVVFDQLSYFKRYYTFVVIILTICYIHPIEKTLSGEKHKSVMMQPNGAPRIMNGLSSHIKNSKECFIRYPNTSKTVKKLGCASFFQPTSRGLDILMKHSFSCLIYYFKMLPCYEY